MQHSELMDSLSRLLVNVDFNKFVKYYTEEVAISQTEILRDEVIQTKEETIANLESISRFKYWLNQQIEELNRELGDIDE